MNEVTLDTIVEANKRLAGKVEHTPLQFNPQLSAAFGANIYLKREDLQHIRSYKLRGALNRMMDLSSGEMSEGVVAASAGNHSQAVAYSCNYLGIAGTIFMPRTTPRQKVEATSSFGNGLVTLNLVGDDFDEAYAEALKHSDLRGLTFIHPFNDPKVISGQGTVGLEIHSDSKEHIDYLLVPIGGGGLISGIGTAMQDLSPATALIGVEQEEASAMHDSLRAGQLISLGNYSHFVDGTAVRRVGELTFSIGQKLGYEVVLVPEGRVCTSVIDLYKQGIVAEPAGALSVAALSELGDKIRGKNVVCVLSGGNNDFDRLAEIRERSLIHEGLKHYFIVEFPQRPGALRQFLDSALGPNDDITRFEYTKRTASESGPALVGIQLKNKADYTPLKEKFRQVGFKFEEVSTNPMFMKYFL